MTSIHLLYDITGSITKYHNDSLGMKVVYLWILTIDFSVLFNVFIKIHEYANYIYSMKEQYLSFKIRPVSVA